MRAFYFTVLTAAALAACSGVDPSDVDPSGPVVTPSDFKIIAGERWTGDLTYLDYSSDKRVTIPANATVEVVSATTLKYSISYPEEPWEDTKAKLKRSKSGRLLDGHVVTSRDLRADGTVALTTLHKGEDNNQAADIRMTYVLSASEFAIEKDVRFQDGAAFVNRNIYRFTRPVAYIEYKD